MLKAVASIVFGLITLLALSSLHFYYSYLADIHKQFSYTVNQIITDERVDSIYYDLYKVFREAEPLCKETNTAACMKIIHDLSTEKLGVPVKGVVVEGKYVVLDRAVINGVIIRGGAEARAG